MNTTATSVVGRCLPPLPPRPFKSARQRPYRTRTARQRPAQCTAPEGVSSWSLFSPLRLRVRIAVSLPRWWCEPPLPVACSCVHYQYYCLSSVSVTFWFFTRGLVNCVCDCDISQTAAGSAVRSHSGVCWTNKKPFPLLQAFRWQSLVLVLV
ncbi:hypothetical protein B0T10DRAFT_305427 [Thelonectria olida]|uniref:Uncharacterized protein n=1 Tax=Thelonectria olida TaxID=1576542 RepID=A0A9P9AN20_9HYPO|nr:hypothetical protein B0T10DRAFT_305427 [Thelonectria olida]